MDVWTYLGPHGAGATQQLLVNQLDSSSSDWRGRLSCKFASSQIWQGQNPSLRFFFALSKKASLASSLSQPRVHHDIYGFCSRNFPTDWHIIVGKSEHPMDVSMIFPSKNPGSQDLGPERDVSSFSPSNPFKMWLASLSILSFIFYVNRLITYASTC